MAVLRHLLTRFSSRRLLSGLGLLVVVAAVAGFFLARRLEAQKHWNAALATEDVEAARYHLAACVRYWPADPEVRFRAARAARQCEDYEEAEEHLSACELLQAASPSTDIRPGFERALLRTQLGESQELHPLVGQLAASGSDKLPLALEALARGHFRTKHYYEATSDTAMLLEKYPGHLRGLLMQAQLFRHFGRQESALECYEQILERTPQARTPRLQLGECLVALGRLSEAIRLYEHMRTSTPDDPEILFWLARCRSDLAQGDEAKDLLDRVLAAHPDHVEALLERGRLEYHHGSQPEAEIFLRRAVAAAPGHAPALSALAMCLEAQGRHDEAAECRATSERCEVEYGRVARQIHRITQQPGDAAGAQAVADGLLRLGRDDEALRWYSAVLREDPQRANVHQTLAGYFEKHGQPHRAAYHRRQARNAAASQWGY